MDETNEVGHGQDIGQARAADRRADNSGADHGNWPEFSWLGYSNGG
jgi:hypothetical protein